MSEIKFELQRAKNAPVSDEELITDLKRVAKETNKKTISSPLYKKLGKYDARTIDRRFGSWKQALVQAGLDIDNSNEQRTDEELFENILVLWQHYGRQPTRRELSVAPSKISQTPYNRRFSSWMKALESFVEYANNSDVQSPTLQEQNQPTRKTGRDPSLRLRFKVLQRDNFTCQNCGASPAKTLGVELHIDHIKPWSKGGETVFDNLQTLCSNCNLGKSNIE